jgi:hypothetical protein
MLVAPDSTNAEHGPAAARELRYANCVSGNGLPTPACPGGMKGRSDRGSSTGREGRWSLTRRHTPIRFAIPRRWRPPCSRMWPSW